jgi:branched-chain amino acid transport system ATP-binding protein
MSVALSIEGLVAGYGATVVIDDVSLTVPAGGTLAILGRNGVGKSTLLKTLMGLTTLHRGAVRLGDARIDHAPTYQRARLGLGYVPQEREIFPSLTTEENLAVSALPGGWSMGAVLDLFPALKERLRTTGNRLSGGEQQMLAIGRALVGGPKVLLLDEPLAGMGAEESERMLALLSGLRENHAILLVEHDMDAVFRIADRITVLVDGAVIASDVPQAVRDNRDVQTAYLGGSA